MGILAELQPGQGETVVMYYDITGNGALGNLFFVNKNSNATDFVRVACTAPDQEPSVDSYLVYDAIVPPNHTCILQGIGLAQLERLYVFSNLGTTNFVFTGENY